MPIHFGGIGKPEPLQYELAGCWSRSITQEHRLVYRVTPDRIDFLQARYHYDRPAIAALFSILYIPPTLLPHWSVDTQTVVILDFGSQYTQLIARRIREQNVFSVVLPCTAPLNEIQAHNPIGLILSGGPSSVYDADAPAADPRVLALGIPVLGVCYGLHFIVHHLGGKVRSAPKREYGHAEVTIEDASSPLFAGLPPAIQVWMSHGDEALELPAGFRRIAVTANALAGH